VTPDIPDHQARILIVDDERQNRDVLEIMLAPEGFVLLSAASGEEALDILARQPPDLILLDIMMPGMDGYQVVSAIKDNPATKHIPVIMVTAMDDRHARILGLRAGAEDFQQTRGPGRTVCAGEEPVGIAHASPDGRWLRINQRLCDILGYSREELQSSAGQELIGSEDAGGEAEALRQMAAGTLDRHVVDEKRYRKRDGSFVWARVNMSVHLDAGGTFQHFISVIEDITERRTLEAQFRQSNKMDAIGKLASGVAHDFNNLLTVILGFGELITADVSMPDQRRKDLDEIMKAARRASGLTKQLLAFSRQQVLNPAPVDVNGLITDMTGMLGRLIGEHIEIALVLATNLPLVVADRGQLEQVVMNLIELSKRILENTGYRVLEAADGDAAEAVFANHDDQIDLVVTDVVMPGCCGPELLSRLQVQAPALRVLYMSGYTEQSAAQKAGIDRGLPFVQKPFTAVEFLRQVRDALDR
jgi:PAS domain S-box-containing protein